MVGRRPPTIAASGAGGGASASGSAPSVAASASAESRPSRRASKIARAAAADRQALQGALDIGRALQRLAHALAQRRSLDEELHQRRAARSIAARIGQRRGEPLGQQARARRRSRCGRWWPAGCRRGSPSSAAHQLEVAPRRGVDLHRAVGALAARRRQRAAACRLLRQLDIVEQRAAGRDLGAREGAEAVERRDVDRPTAGACARCRCRSAPRAAASAPAFQSSSTAFSGRRAPAAGRAPAARPARAAPAPRRAGRGSSGWAAKSPVERSSQASASSPCASASAAR